MNSYLEESADLEYLKDQTVAVIGYGIQGRAQSRNLRDSGINVIVCNKSDRYYDRAIQDGFEVPPIEEAVKKASVIMMLIPDQAHQNIYDTYIAPNIQPGSMLVVAHGYSIRFGNVQCPDNIDVILLAPRFPGDVLRENYLNNRGTLAFLDVYQNATGKAKEKSLALAKAIGYMRRGGKLLGVSLKEETEIDLFIEQYLIPSFLNIIETGFNVLIENGYTPEVALIELYTSGEIIGLLEEGIQTGMYQSFHNNTSPTCQYGVMESYNTIITNDIKIRAEAVLNEIRNGSFSKRLATEAEQGYPNLKKFNKSNNENDLIKTQKRIMKIEE
jgi:ketol-acid reductoisomerase